MNKAKLFISTLLLFLLFCTLYCYSQFTINSSELTYKSLHENATIVNLKQKELSINQVLQLPEQNFLSLSNENTDLGFTNDNYWLHFKIKNETKDEVQYYVETSRPIVDLANFYQIKPNGTIIVQKSGDNIPFEERSLKQRKTIFKISLMPSEVGNYYIHLKSDGEVINAPVLLRTAENLISETFFEQIVFGFFYGILFIASILYFFFFYAMKEKVFLYYSLYVVFIGLLQFSLDGYFYQFFTPGAGWFSNKSVLLFAVISGFFLGNYAQNYLDVKNISRKLNLSFNILYVLLGTLFVVVIFVPQWFKYCYPIMNALGLFLLILIITSMVFIYIKTKNVYQFFTLGILSLVTGFCGFYHEEF